MIPYIHPSPFAEASLHFLIALVLSGEKPPCGAEPTIELGPAVQQADALPTEPRRTINFLHFYCLSPCEDPNKKLLEKFCKNVSEDQRQCRLHSSRSV